MYRIVGPLSPAAQHPVYTFTWHSEIRMRLGVDRVSAANSLAAAVLAVPAQVL